ncbi:protein kinase domain-containing protein [Nocardia sp. NPDC003693]
MSVRDLKQGDIARVRAALPGYEVDGQVGRGGCGVVLAGTHRGLARRVAIKQIPPQFADDAQVRRRFVDEARMMAALDHPHVVPVYDYIEHEDLCLLVLEFLPGGTVENRFVTAGFEATAAVAVALACAAGLEAAHRHGILHRDVKPSNLMFAANGTLKLTDFGIAKIIGGAETLVTRAGDIVGTPSYIAPEQVRGEELSPSTDVYALATMLYQLLSGALPFPPGTDAVAMLFAHAYGEPIPLARVAPAVPQPIADTVMRGLASDPADRFATAESFGIALAEPAAHCWGVNWLTPVGIPLIGADTIAAAATGGAHSRPHTPPRPLSAPPTLLNPATPPRPHTPVVADTPQRPHGAGTPPRPYGPVPPSDPVTRDVPDPKTTALQRNAGSPPTVLNPATPPHPVGRVPDPAYRPGRTRPGPNSPVPQQQSAGSGPNPTNQLGTPDAAVDADAFGAVGGQRGAHEASAMGAGPHPANPPGPHGPWTDASEPRALGGQRDAQRASAPETVLNPATPAATQARQYGPQSSSSAETTVNPAVSQRSYHPGSPGQSNRVPGSGAAGEPAGAAETTVNPATPRGSGGVGSTAGAPGRGSDQGAPGRVPGAAMPGQGSGAGVFGRGAGAGGTGENAGAAETLVNPATPPYGPAVSARASGAGAQAPSGRPQNSGNPRVLPPGQGVPSAGPRRPGGQGRPGQPSGAQTGWAGNRPPDGANASGAQQDSRGSSPRPGNPDAGRVRPPASAPETVVRPATPLWPTRRDADPEQRVPTVRRDGYSGGQRPGAGGGPHPAHPGAAGNVGADGSRSDGPVAGQRFSTPSAPQRILPPNQPQHAGRMAVGLLRVRPLEPMRHDGVRLIDVDRDDLVPVQRVVRLTSPRVPLISAGVLAALVTGATLLGLGSAPDRDLPAPGTVRIAGMDPAVARAVELDLSKPIPLTLDGIDADSAELSVNLLGRTIGGSTTPLRDGAADLPAPVNPYVLAGDLTGELALSRNGSDVATYRFGVHTAQRGTTTATAAVIVLLTLFAAAYTESNARSLRRGSARVAATIGLTVSAALLGIALAAASWLLLAHEPTIPALAVAATLAAATGATASVGLRRMGKRYRYIRVLRLRERS